MIDPADRTALRWRSRLIALGLFAVAMAYVEAAAVAYLREVYGITDPLQGVPIEPTWLIVVEVGREVATLVMLLGAGWLAGWQTASRVGGFLVAFGLWDIAYYGWLRVMVGWPASIADWDLLFLVPVPWWGPVWAPILAAALFVVVGVALMSGAASGVRHRVDARSALIAGMGSVVALGTVMAPALAAVPGGVEAVIEARPESFAWPAYLVGWALVAWAGARVVLRGRGD
jgi:hypothetical protein